jgi:hypothetical protein
MTQESEDQIIGALVRERRDVSMKLETLLRLVKQKAGQIRDLADHLGSHPERVFIGAGAHPAQAIVFAHSEIDAESLGALTEELRQVKANRERLDEECRKFGL